MQKIYIDITDLNAMLFERNQIISLLDNTRLWSRIPLEQRFELVESSEFLILMGESFTEHTRRMLEAEVEAMVSTIH